MKKLFIYNSFTGNGEIVANKLKEQGFEIRKVIEKKKMPKSFFWGMMSGGFRAGMNKKGKLIDYNPDVKEFDEIVIGTPIWNAKLTPITNSIIAETNFENKKLTFVMYSGSGEGKKADKKIKKLFPEASIIHLKEPKKYKDQLEKIKSL